MRRQTKAAPLTYGDLPERDRSIRTIGKREISGYPITIWCPACGERYSASRGDYWDRAHQKIKCSYCGTAMQIATERTVMVRLTPEIAAKLTEAITGTYAENPSYQLPGIVDVLQRCYAVIKESDGADEHGEILRELETLGMGYRP